MMMRRPISKFVSFRRSRRAVEVLTGNLLMLMVMAAVFSSVAFLVKSSSEKYADAQESEMVNALSAKLKSKVSEAWGIGSDEVPLDLPEMIGSRYYIIENDPTGNYLIVRTGRGTYRIRNSGVKLSRRSIRSSEPHFIGIRDGRVVVDPAPLTEISSPLDGSVFSGKFNVSYRTSSSADEHSIYLDGSLVTTASTSLDGFTFDPGVPPTNMSDGTHSITVVASNQNGEGSDSATFTMDRTPPVVDLNVSQIRTDELSLTITEIQSYGGTVETYIFVTDDKNLPVRGLDEDNFYIYNSADEVVNGGRFELTVTATDAESRVDAGSYVIERYYLGQTLLTRSRDGRWDSKSFNQTTSFLGQASDIAGNTQTSPNITRSPTNRLVSVGAQDRKSDLSLIFTNDVSGSMDWVMWKDEDPKPGEESRLDFMKSAVKSFIDKMYPEDEAAICSFTTNYAAGTEEIILEQGFTATNEDGKNQLRATVDGLSTTDGTPLYDALYESVLWIRDRSKFRAVLVLTDGKDLNYATGKPYSTRSSIEVIDLAREEGIPIYCVGLGEEDKVDVNVLNSISQQTEGRFYLAPTPEKLQEAYDQIAGELLSGYKVTYIPGYMISGGEEITVMVYDEDDRSGRQNVVLPEPTNLPPVLSLSAPNGGETWVGTETIQWTVSDPEGSPVSCDLYYSDDAGSSWNLIVSGLSGSSHNWDTTSVPDGNQYKIRVVADDGEEQSSDESDGVFVIDNAFGDGEDPLVAITKPNPGQKVKNDVTIEGDASDSGGSGLDRVEIWIGGDYEGLATLGAGSFELTFDSTVLPNGLIDLEARAYDGAGNFAIDSVQVEINN
jgi:hypothetical protein